MASMRYPTRTKALLVGAACGVALLGAGLAFRQDLAFHYHVWRLERALSVEDAQPWLAKLKDDVQDPIRAQRLVAMLGRRRPRLTFWTFQWPHTVVLPLRGMPYAIKIGEDHQSLLFFFAPLGPPALHFARSLETRLRRDEGFLPVMAHFIRWSRVSGPLLTEPDDPILFKVLWKPQLLAGEPVAQEVALRNHEAYVLAEAWLLGMSPLPPPVELSFPLCEADVDRVFRRWEDMEGWARARRGRLRFDAALGRFVEVPAGEGSPAMPHPTEPLPGWTGPVPQVP